MKSIKNFFSEELIEKIIHHVESQRDSSEWITNSNWIPEVVKHSERVDILEITKTFSKKVKEQFVSHNQKYSRFRFRVLYYEWNRGSYIPWHDDSNHCIGATLYLNKEWDTEDGGIFMYYEDSNREKLKCIAPKYNNLVISDNNESHHVSMICHHSKEIRKTIQIWMYKIIDYN